MSGPVTALSLRDWSQRRGEPEWLTRRRLAALERVVSASVDWPAIETALAQPPLAAPPLPPELAAQGVVLATLREAVVSWPRLLEPRLGSLAQVEESAALNEAFWTDGYFVKISPGQHAPQPLQLGSELGRAAFERSLILVEEGAALDFVEGCTAPKGLSGDRNSVLEAFVGKNASLRAASLQAWPSSVVYVASKLVRAEAGARVEWLDGNLGARLLRKHVSFDLGAGAHGDIFFCGFAGPGQEQNLEARIASMPGASSRVQERVATRGGGRIRSSGGGLEADRRQLRVEDIPQAQRFYLATRGLEGRQAEAVVLHAFFEPFARRLPLEFSVEFTRLLDTELDSGSP